MPLSTYENIIPQRGKIVKRLAAVFKKILRDFFCLGGGHFFCAEFRVSYQREGKAFFPL